MYSFQTWLFLLLLATGPAFGLEQLLPPEQAFRVQAVLVNQRMILLQYQIAPGYYLYRDRFKFVAEGATLGVPQLPDGLTKPDPNFGRAQVFEQAVEIRLPLTAPLSRPMVLKATVQGCTKFGVCYVPYTHTLRITPDGHVMQSWTG